MNTEDSLTLTTTTDSLTVDSTTLTSLLSENDQLKSFMEENSAVLEKISLQLQDMILECEQSFKKVQSNLQKLEERLPEVISEVEHVKECIDQKHKASTKATVAGSSTSILGGALMVGGILGAPFTFGASLGVTAAGAVLTGAGGVTAAGAKIYDRKQAKKGNTKVKEWIEEIELLCKEAQSEYEELQQLCEKLGDSALKVCPAFHAETREEKISLGWNLFGLFRATAVSTGVNNKVAAAFIQALGSNLTKGDGPGINAPLIALNVTMKAVGNVVVVAGIVFNAMTVGYAAHRLIKDKKCPTSEEIAKQIEELKVLQERIKKILQEEYS